MSTSPVWHSTRLAFARAVSMHVDSYWATSWRLAVPLIAGCCRPLLAHERQSGRRLNAANVYACFPASKRYVSTTFTRNALQISSLNMVKSMSCVQSSTECFCAKWAAVDSIVRSFTSDPSSGLSIYSPFFFFQWENFSLWGSLLIKAYISRAAWTRSILSLTRAAVRYLCRNFTAGRLTYLKLPRPNFCSRSFFKFRSASIPAVSATRTGPICPNRTLSTSALCPVPRIPSL